MTWLIIIKKVLLQIYGENIRQINHKKHQNNEYIYTYMRVYTLQFMQRIVQIWNIHSEKTKIMWLERKNFKRTNTKKERI